MQENIFVGIRKIRKFGLPQTFTSETIVLVIKNHAIKNYLEDELGLDGYSVESYDRHQEFIRDIADGMDYDVLAVELNGDVNNARENLLQISQSANNPAEVISFSDRNYFPRASDLHLVNPSKEHLREVILGYIQ